MKKVAFILAIALIAAPASANLLTGTWGQYNASWGTSTISGMSSTGVTIATTGGSAVAYQVIPTTAGQSYTLSGHATQAPGVSAYWTEVLLFDNTGQNLPAGDGIDAPCPDGNIILKSDGWGMNQDVLAGPGGAALSTATWQYPNNPTGSLTIVAAGSSIVVGMKVGASGGNNTTQFTSLDLTPEPSALMLLLGGLPLLLRRRRA